MKKIAFRLFFINLPVPLLGALLSAPHGSSFFDPSPKGSLDGEEAEGGAGEPHASSVLTGAEATAENIAHKKDMDKSMFSIQAINSIINI